MTKTNSLGIYVHIPFCIKKCGYCDFISFDEKSPLEWHEYEKELIKEIKSYGDNIGGDYNVDTIFLGGGTPSILNPQIIQEILDQIKSSFKIDAGAEITIEANPGTLSEEKLRRYLAAGINRLSIGVQSFDDDLLRLLGRVHGQKEARQAYKIAREVGFDNINLDLMFAIPSQTMEKWESSLIELIELNPEHVSFYGLSYEEGTPFDQARKRREIVPIDDSLDRGMYKKGISLLINSGYEHYEISNMAKPGLQCKHNLKYWGMDDYLGLGIGAHSFIKGKRFSNTVSWDQYFSVNKIETEHINTEYDNMSEYIFTGMRKTTGISFRNFREKFERDYFDYIGQGKEQLWEYRDKGLLFFDTEGMHFTEEGIDFSNLILADLM